MIYKSEFNYRRNSRGECVLAEGAEALVSDSSMCDWSTPFWYDRTAYRKVKHSACEGGLTLDQGTAHTCPGHTSGTSLIWFLIILPFAILAAIWYGRRRYGKGRIRLNDYDDPSMRSRSRGEGVVEILKSVPWVVISALEVVIGYAKEIEIPWLSAKLRGNRSHYTSVYDSDA